MLFEGTRNAMLSSTQVVFYLVDLLQDKNKEVRGHTGAEDRMC